MTAFIVVVSWAFLASVAFPVLYSRNRPWRSSLPGRSAFAFSVIMALVMAVAFFAIVVNVHLPAWIRFLVYASVAVGSTVQTIVLVRTQMRGR